MTAVGKGKVINNAFEIIRKTFQEINLLKTDLENLILAIDPELGFSEQYSSGTNSLYLKANHTYLFQRLKQDNDSKRIIEELTFAMICIFYDEGNLTRINLKEAPEIWFGLLQIKGNENKCRSWDIYNLLTKDELVSFKDTNISIGGEICRYYWTNGSKDDEEWIGSFIGYPLAEISDKEFLEKNVVTPLFREFELIE